ncbi:MAG: hypothetical protein EZS28_017951 [Streblomastix strix]|uniref:Uncharacterized protein n=1 Tax=Streblomastix strix TaxID=222440 RepID=A0A5J4VUZ0_9EUKA|nr:MAG: hypothetical protein EZS28_017951 [Streblomastix strix]
MDKSQALKFMMENDTNTEYFDGGYFIRDKKQIKCFEDGKRGLKVVTQAQQNKLMMQAKGKTDQQFGHKKQPAKMFESDSESDNSVDAIEEEQPKPVQRVKRKNGLLSSSATNVLQIYFSSSYASVNIYYFTPPTPLAIIPAVELIAPIVGATAPITL